MLSRKLPWAFFLGGWLVTLAGLGVAYWGLTILAEGVGDWGKYPLLGGLLIAGLGILCKVGFIAQSIDEKREKKRLSVLFWVEVVLMSSLVGGYFFFLVFSTLTWQP